MLSGLIPDVDKLNFRNEILTSKNTYFVNLFFNSHILALIVQELIKFRIF